MDSSNEHGGDARIVDLVCRIMGKGAMVVETPAEAVLVKLLELRGTPITFEKTLRDIDADWESEQAYRARYGKNIEESAPEMPGFYRRRGHDEDPLTCYFSDEGSQMVEGQYRVPDAIVIMFGNYETKWERSFERDSDYPIPDGCLEVPTEWDSIHQVFVSKEQRGLPGCDIGPEFPIAVYLTEKGVMREYILDPRTKDEATRDETASEVVDRLLSETQSELDRSTRTAVVLLCGIFVGAAALMLWQWIHGII